MRKLTVVSAILLASFIILYTHRPRSEASDAVATTSVQASFQPSPEMQRVLDAFVGDWSVTETFEISGSRQGKTRQGTASFRAGPGPSLVEDYKSNGSAGELRFLALIWWDQSARGYRFLTCANNDGCTLRGTARWEGNTFVNSWQVEVNGESAIFRDSFVDISPAAFRLLSEGRAKGKTIWRVVTAYKRLNGTGR